MSRSNLKSAKMGRTKIFISRNIRLILNVVFTGIIVATLFTAATPPGMLSGSLTERLAETINAAATPTPEWPTPTARPRPRIGLVVGHWGDQNDPGAVCPDGLTELKVNQDIATLVQQKLKSEGFDVDLLQEFDPSLNGYQALALVSIHADSCNYINNQATGFKVAASLNTPRPDKTARLTACLRNRYRLSTQLNVHNSITPDMSSYHAFDEINQDTPAVIIETGFLNLDRQLLTQQPDLVASGIADGILCYIYNQDISNQPTNEPTE
ncbi:MAG: N-acetylmuramoyl-L-alanine amidase [Anaerolineales bacterium]|nr:N-acetylmuramoyl-L-alanine amidase [Anaerolineales bacterium]